MGCTHYPLLTSVIQEVMGNKVRLVNPAEETARETQALLERMQIGVSSSSERHEPQFFVSDEPEHFRKQGEKFLKSAIRSVVRVPNDTPHKAVR